jgi:DNA-directed RNA polymerase specialized sigma24 family protein
MTNHRDSETAIEGASAADTTTRGEHEEWNVRRLRNNCEQTWGHFKETYERDLRRRLKRLLAHTKVLPSDAIDDIIQNLYVRLLGNDRKLIRQWLDDQRVPFGAFLWTIAKNLARDEIKAARSHGTRSIDEDEGRREGDEGEEDGAEAWYEKGRGAAFVAADRADRSDVEGTGLAFRGEVVERAVMARHGAVLASCGWIPTRGHERRAFFGALDGAVLVSNAWDREAVVAWFGGAVAFVIDKHGRRIESFAVTTPCAKPTLRAARAAMKAWRAAHADRHVRAHVRSAPIAEAA